MCSSLRRRVGVSFVPVDADGVPAEHVTPANAVTGRHLVYLHGGAYLTGDPQSYRGLVGTLAQRLRARVLVPDYRFAPEAVSPPPSMTRSPPTAGCWGHVWHLLVGHLPAADEAVAVAFAEERLLAA